MKEMLNYLGVSGFAFVFLAVFIEITPIKINPLEWLGKKFTQATRSEIQVLRDDIKGCTSKLDEHIAQSYRDKILRMQNECLQGIRHSREEWEEVMDACALYEEHINSNHLTNGKCDQAMRYLEKLYQKCLESSDFSDVTRVCTPSEIKKKCSNL